MAITFVDVATLTQETAVTSFVISKPAGVQNGDILWAILTSDAAPITWASPAGWTVLRDDLTSGGNTTEIAYKVITDAASEPASYEWTTGSATAGVGAILAYRGVSTSSPSHAESFNSFTGTTQTWEGITTTIDGCMLVAWVTSDNSNADGAGSYAVPAGFTSRASFQNTSQRNTILVCDKLKSPAGTESGNSTSYTTFNAATGLGMGTHALAPPGTEGPKLRTVQSGLRW